MQQENIQHLAVIRLSALGDVCHAMAVVQSIMKRYPVMQVTWVTSPLESQSCAFARWCSGCRVR